MHVIPESEMKLSGCSHKAHGAEHTSANIRSMLHQTVLAASKHTMNNPSQCSDTELTENFALSLFSTTKNKETHFCTPFCFHLDKAPANFPPRPSITQYEFPSSLFHHKNLFRLNAVFWHCFCFLLWTPMKAGCQKALQVQLLSTKATQSALQLLPVISLKCWN